jgi:hypothetical protein
MRLLIVSATVVLVTAAAWGTNRKAVVREETTSSAAAKPRAESRPPGEGLVVHEWGTFTSFSGSDGVRLEFRPLVDEDLPPFVLDRFLQSGEVNFLTKSQVRVRMRMETPVTYFYTDRERDVNVRVSFPDGLLTEFYPPVARMEPKYKLFEQLPLKGSSLDWGDIHLIPADRLQARVEDPQRRRLLESLLPASLTPAADERFHYGHARETDSALVHVHRPKPGAKARPLVPAGDFFEKFLFYRGVGNFDLPLKLTAAGDGTFELTNSGDDPIRALFLIDAGAESIRFAAFEQIAAGDRLKLVQSAEPATIDALAEAVKAALVTEGLYEKEALAMVKTWRSSWFGETGTRLLYVVPRPITDALLPLEISPTPEETVRVLVGRMEIMTPEEESRIAAMVQKSAAERQAEWQTASSEGRAANYAGPAELTSLGRLAEPALARVRTICKDPAIRAEVRLLLQGMTGTAGR